MIPQSQPKKKSNSSKVNLTISAVVHTLIILGLVYFAAREGYLGKKIQKISVNIVKEKKPEPPKPKEEPKPKVEPPKVEPPKVAVPKPAAPKPATVTAPPVVAPAAVDTADFHFSDGAKDVITANDPVQAYKGYMEFQLRSKWNRPEDMDDAKYVDDVQVKVGKDGSLEPLKWLKESGNRRWDQTVRDVFKTVTRIDSLPPTNFPSVVVIRFDVDEETQPVLMP
jgi:hypothetical protein